MTLWWYIYSVCECGQIYSKCESRLFSWCPCNLSERRGRESDDWICHELLPGVVSYQLAQMEFQATQKGCQIWNMKNWNFVLKTQINNIIAWTNIPLGWLPYVSAATTLLIIPVLSKHRDVRSDRRISLSSTRVLGLINRIRELSWNIYKASCWQLENMREECRNSTLCEYSTLDGWNHINNFWAHSAAV